jgi:hypothetical protein
MSKNESLERVGVSGVAWCPFCGTPNYIYALKCNEPDSVYHIVDECEHFVELDDKGYAVFKKSDTTLLP